MLRYRIAPRAHRSCALLRYITVVWIRNTKRRYYRRNSDSHTHTHLPRISALQFRCEMALCARESGWKRGGNDRKSLNHRAVCARGEFAAINLVKPPRTIYCQDISHHTQVFRRWRSGKYVLGKNYIYCSSASASQIGRTAWKRGQSSTRTYIYLSIGRDLCICQPLKHSMYKLPNWLYLKFRFKMRKTMWRLLYAKKHSRAP